MEKETVLKIEFQPVFDKWAWKITKQNVDILKRGRFGDKELKVYSVVQPQYYKRDNRLYILGEYCDGDNDINFCTTEEKELIVEKVKAINEKYGIKKRWRAEYGNIYYYMNEFFEITWLRENHNYFNNKKYENGNHFKTETEALEYAEYMKQKSLEWHEMRGRDE